jgi:hypothetical protein
MKSFSSIRQRIKKHIRKFEFTIWQCEELMRQGFDPIDLEELRVTLANLKAIEWLLKDICRTEKRERKRRARNE